MRFLLLCLGIAVVGCGTPTAKLDTMASPETHVEPEIVEEPSGPLPFQIRYETKPTKLHVGEFVLEYLHDQVCNRSNEAVDLLWERWSYWEDDYPHLIGRYISSNLEAGECYGWRDDLFTTIRTLLAVYPHQYETQWEEVILEYWNARLVPHTAGQVIARIVEADTSKSACARMITAAEVADPSDEIVTRCLETFRGKLVTDFAAMFHRSDGPQDATCVMFRQLLLPVKKNGELGEHWLKTLEDAKSCSGIRRFDVKSITLMPQSGFKFPLAAEPPKEWFYPNVKTNRQRISSGMSKARGAIDCWGFVEFEPVFDEDRRLTSVTFYACDGHAIYTSVDGKWKISESSKATKPND